MANRNFEFSWEFKDFCVRTVHENWKDRNSPLKKNCPVELIKYFDENHKNCYVVAWFKLDDEGYELHFVGNRPMVNIEVVYRNKVISNSDIISSDNVERIKFKNLFINNLRYLICGMF